MQEKHFFFLILKQQKSKFGKTCLSKYGCYGNVKSRGQ